MTINPRRFLCMESIRPQITEQKKIMTFAYQKCFVFSYILTGIILIVLFPFNTLLNPQAPEINAGNWNIEVVIMLLLLWPIFYLYYLILLYGISLLIHFLPPNSTFQLMNYDFLALIMLFLFLIAPFISFVISEIVNGRLSR